LTTEKEELRRLLVGETWEWWWMELVVQEGRPEVVPPHPKIVYEKVEQRETLLGLA